jgi:hypothetical protein
MLAPNATPQNGGGSMPPPEQQSPSKAKPSGGIQKFFSAAGGSSASSVKTEAKDKRASPSIARSKSSKKAPDSSDASVKQLMVRSCSIICTLLFNTMLCSERKTGTSKPAQQS